MKFLEKMRDFSYLVHVNVKPNSKMQAIIENDEFLTISVKSKAIKNKANKELINLIKKKLEISPNQIQIIESPAGSQSGEPNLFTSGEGNIYMSWIEADKTGGYGLHFSVFENNRWTESKTIATSRAK